MAELLIIDAGYSKIKSIDKHKKIKTLHNAHMPSTEGERKIPLNDSTKKVSLYHKHKDLLTTRLYGEIPCQMSNHIQGISGRKIDEIRFNVAAMLTENYHLKEINLVCIYNEEAEFLNLETSLLGEYKVIVNGTMIQCKIVSVKCLLEGVGTYFSLKDATYINPKKMRILDLGLGVANDLIVDKNGEIEYYSTEPSLSIFNLASIIEKSSLFQDRISKTSKTRSNYASIAYALEKDSVPGNLSLSEWNLIKNYGLETYFKTLRSHLMAPAGNSSDFVTCFVLTGGGAALLKRESALFETIFTIPQEPEIASLQGILRHPYVQKLTEKGGW
jgi:hypothetical protein